MDGTTTGGVGMYLGKCTVRNVFHHERCASFDRGRDAIGERVTHALSTHTRDQRLFPFPTRSQSDHTYRTAGQEKHALRLSH